MRTIKQFNFSNKRVLLRVDLNVPVVGGKILDETRIDKIIPTIKYLQDQNAKLILVSHFGRPKSLNDTQYSLQFMQPVLAQKLNQEVLFSSEIIGRDIENITHSLHPKQVILLENIRFFEGETKNDFEFASNLAKLADYYINDAFSCSHRAHASIEAIAKILPSCAGLLLTEEIDNLSKYLNNNRLPAEPASGRRFEGDSERKTGMYNEVHEDLSNESTYKSSAEVGLCKKSNKKPMMAIIGGSKISTKLGLLNTLIEKVDHLVIGGAMANTFLKAQNIEIGSSLYESDLVETAKNILNAKKCNIILPQDVVIAKEIKNNAENKIVDITNIPQNEMILDIGPSSCSHIIQILTQCKTVVCNGPLGVFEHFPFSVGTTLIAREISKLTYENKIISIAGGGDIIAALSAAGLLNQFSYISTAGGAFLEWLEGKQLPGIKVLCEN